MDFKIWDFMENSSQIIFIGTCYVYASIYTEKFYWFYFSDQTLIDIVLHRQLMSPTIFERVPTFFHSTFFHNNDIIIYRTILATSSPEWQGLICCFSILCICDWLKVVPSWNNQKESQNFHWMIWMRLYIDSD